METPPSPPRFHTLSPPSAASKRRCLFHTYQPPPPPEMPPANSPSSPAAAIQLPLSVESVLARIDDRHKCGLPDSLARRELADLGEAGALEILSKVFNNCRVGSISALVMYLARLAKQSPNATLAPAPYTTAVSESPCSHRESVGSSSRPGTGYSNSAPPAPVQVPAGWPEATPHLLALGELEFRKAFLILSYIGSKRLEDTVSVEKIRSFKDLPMGAFEMHAWTDIGSRCVPEMDRCKVRHWDLEKTHMYDCYVYRTGSITFKGPYLQSAKTHLQRIIGDDYVLAVKFEHAKEDCFRVYHKIASEGIFVGLRKYHFFVYKDVDKVEKEKTGKAERAVKSFTGGCYFVCTESRCPIDEGKPHILLNKRINEARSVFMHIHTARTLAKYMKRFSLILSKTVRAEVDLESASFQIIDDIPCLNLDGSKVYRDGELQIQTDGTGFISRDLALKCPLNIFKGQYLASDHEKHSRLSGSPEDPLLAYMRSPPLLLQCRLFYKGYAIKGTLLVNENLPSKTIQIRPSMIKIEPDATVCSVQCCSSLEIVTTSYQPKKNFLSKILIALLHYGGVPATFFLGLLVESLTDVRSAQFSKRAAAQLAYRYSDIGGFELLSMILSGIPLDESYLQYKLGIFMKEDRKSLLAGKLAISDSYYLMGTTDPTHTLYENEVCVILESGQVSGDVLVYRNPGLHIGDIHRLKATYVQDMEKFVGHSKYGIFFSSKGPRSVADEIAGGDYDGDLYWVSRNRVLLECFQPSDPWVPESAHEPAFENPENISDFSHAVLEEKLFQNFLDGAMNPSYTMGIAADSWLSFMDRLLTLSEDCHTEKACLQMKIAKLIDIYYVALDAPKTGKKVSVPFDLQAEKFPHYMEKKHAYHSTSILGEIYDKAKSSNCHQEDSGVSKLPCFCDPMPSSASMDKWSHLYREFRYELKDALGLDKQLKDAAAAELKEKYRLKLHSSGNKEKILDEALAIYHVVYDNASICGNQGSKCYLPWEIACEELCGAYVDRQRLKRLNIHCVPSILAELF